MRKLPDDKEGQSGTTRMYGRKGHGSSCKNTEPKLTFEVSADVLRCCRSGEYCDEVMPLSVIRVWPTDRDAALFWDGTGCLGLMLED